MQNRIHGFETRSIGTKTKTIDSSLQTLGVFLEFFRFVPQSGDDSSAERGAQRLVEVDADGLRWHCDGCGRRGPVTGQPADGKDMDEGRDKAAELGQCVELMRTTSKDVSVQRRVLSQPNRT